MIKLAHKYSDNGVTANALLKMVSTFGVMPSLCRCTAYPNRHPEGPFILVYGPTGLMGSTVMVHHRTEAHPLGLKHWRYLFFHSLGVPESTGGIIDLQYQRVLKYLMCVDGDEHGKLVNN